MRIEIFANGLSSVSELQSGLDMLHSRISSTISDLQDVKRRMSKMTGGLGLLSDAYQNVQRRVQKEERRMTAVERVSEASQTFLSNTVNTDNHVARLMNQNQEKFFRSHAWLRPVVEGEKSWWEQRLEDWNNFWGDVGEFLKSAGESIANWVKEHAVELIIGTVAILIGAVLTVLTGGTFLAALAAGLQVAVISAAISAALSAGIAALTGGDVLEAFGDGLASGYMWGGIFFAISQTIAAISHIFSNKPTISNVTNATDLISSNSGTPSVPTTQYGDSFGKMGTYVKKPNVSVDWDIPIIHGAERMASHGMSKEMVEQIVKNGKALSQAGGKFAFVSKEGVVVLTSEGKLVTCWGAKDFTPEMIEIVKKLFGG